MTPSPTPTPTSNSGSGWEGIPWTEMLGWVPVLIAAIIAAGAALHTARIAADSALRVRIVDILREEDRTSRTFRSDAGKEMGRVIRALHRFSVRMRYIGAVAIATAPSPLPPELVSETADEKLRLAEALEAWQQVVGQSEQHGAEVSRSFEGVDRQIEKVVAHLNTKNFDSADAEIDVLRRYHQPQLIALMQRMSALSLSLVVDAMRAANMRTYVETWRGKLDSRVRQVEGRINRGNENAPPDARLSR